MTLPGCTGKHCSSTRSRAAGRDHSRIPAPQDHLPVCVRDLAARAERGFPFLSVDPQCQAGDDAARRQRDLGAGLPLNRGVVSKRQRPHRLAYSGVGIHAAFDFRLCQGQPAQGRAHRVAALPEIELNLVDYRADRISSKAAHGRWFDCVVGHPGDAVIEDSGLVRGDARRDGDRHVRHTHRSRASTAAVPGGVPPGSTTEASQGGCRRCAGSAPRRRPPGSGAPPSLRRT